jgi:protein phosphatase
VLRVAEKFSDTNTGRQRRANEDSFLARAPVFVVADGMGGARAGEVASHTAVEAFGAGLPDDDTSAEQRLAQRVREANERIHALSRQDSRRAGMGTTLTAAYVGDEEVSFAHVGDSRAYCLRDGVLQRLTEDHSLVEELRRQGRLTEQEAEEHPQRSIITRALGPEPDVEIDTLTHRARAGDVYLLCSDGLTGMVSEERVKELLLESKSLEQAGRALIAAANDAGGRDNITVVLFRLEDPSVPAQSDDQPTIVASADEVHDRLAQAPPAEPSTAASAAAPAAAARPRRLHPRMPSGDRASSPRRGLAALRVVRAPIALLVVLAVLIAGGWIASQSVYFVGTDRNGQIAIFRGVPYDLPAGVHLYRSNFVSGVTLNELSAAERKRLLDHKLRSHDDASDLVRRLELGQISQQ